MALVMAQMPDVWRKVLAEHLDDDRGRCRACRNANGETASWPCQTYRVAQEAKWVSEGNLPGTGPHGPGPSASPRLSRYDDLPVTGGYSTASAGGYGTSPGGYSPPASGSYDLPRSGGYDLPPSGGYGSPSGSYDLPRSGGYDLPPSSGYDLPGNGRHGSPSPEGYGYGSPEGLGYGAPVTDGYGMAPIGDAGRDLPVTGGYGLSDPLGPYAPVYEDAATAFGGGTGSSSPALASLPSLPATSVPVREPEPMGWARDPFASDEPQRRSESQRRSEPQSRPWESDESASYGSTVDAPYGSSFGVDDRPRSSWR